MNPVVYGLILLSITIIFGLVYLFLGKQAIRHIQSLKVSIKANEKIKQELDEICKDLTEKNHVLEQEWLHNNYKRHEIEKLINSIEYNYNTLCTQVTEKEEMLKSLDAIYQSQLKEKKNSIDAEAEEFKVQAYNVADKEVEDYKIQCENTKKQMIEEYEKEKANFEHILQEYRDRQESIIKVNKEQEEMKENAKFYQLNITEDDIADAQALQNIKHLLHHPEILDKLIYKTYYEKPYTDLVGRVIGTRKITGSYKLTNTLNQKVYIGQAVDIGERWRQHLKRAVGAEPMTSNKLYPAMKESGPYNFTWQVVAECKKEDLTTREKYWIEFYEGQGYGYNIKG